MAIMNQEEQHNELRKMIREIGIESPGPAFSHQVMEALLAEEKREKPAFVTEPILGKNFWILTLLFILLLMIFLIFGRTWSPGSESAITMMLRWITRYGSLFFGDFWSLFLQKAGNIPVISAAVFLAVTILTLADRFLPEKKKEVTEIISE
ncbi:MAG TPA: hypothetical protein PLD74_01575 [Prolixibacteraceae bacterium]|nr:hypothetical protein [Prolixibacteraceae bacterium]HOR99401.1 hypothetical protein [Prolixibacteraceae bacterium]HOS89873.1 hypothetical protein [Prolixibacteraceae bacterium]HPL44544.1 hypothetical protein [Prolixibacteraceae bacterium]HQE51025.1 hypothetical protein [Prolixibacteraceae bacterium]